MGVSLYVMRLGIRIVKWLPRAARRDNSGIRAGRRFGVVPNDHDIRRSVSICDFDQASAVGSASDVVHAVTALVALALGRAAGSDVEAVGTLENFLVAFDEGIDEGARRVVV